MLNSGYSGYRRSIRSEEAINGYEVPLSMINKKLISEFLEDKKEEEELNENIDFLTSVQVAKWKFVAKEIVKPSSWHHTGTYFNKTNHYSLLEVSEKLTELKDNLNDLYFEYAEDKKVSTDLKYGVIKVQVWGGSKKYTKLIGYDVQAGIVINDWFYYYNDNLNKKISRYKTTANKVDFIKNYDSYKELVKEYIGTKQMFNQLIKDKTK